MCSPKPVSPLASVALTTYVDAPCSHAKRLQRQRGVELVAERCDECRPPRDTVELRKIVHAAVARGCGLQRREIGDGPLEMQEPRPRVVAGDCEAGLRLGHALARFVGEDEARHRIRAADGLRQRLVIVAQRFEALDERIVRSQALGEFGHLAGRDPIGLRKNDVEGNRGGAELVQALDELCHNGARPGPLAYALEAVFVDIGDAHRNGLVGARLEAQEIVENHHAKLNERRRLAPPADERGKEDREWQQKMQAALEVFPELGPSFNASANCSGGP